MAFGLSDEEERFLASAITFPDSRSTTAPSSLVPPKSIPKAYVRSLAIVRQLPPSSFSRTRANFSIPDRLFGSSTT